MFNWVLNKSLKTNQHSALSFSVNALYRFQPFFRIPHGLIFNFCITSAQSSDYRLGLPCQKKQTYLLYDSHAKVI